jgi:hypothetical protein
LKDNGTKFCNIDNLHNENGTERNFVRPLLPGLTFTNDLTKTKSKIEEETVDKGKLALDLTKALRKQGFTISHGSLIFDASSKKKVRELHSIAVNHLLEKNRSFIEKYDEKFTKTYVADGGDVVPQEIEPRLITVDDGEKSIIFKWVKLHWSIPVSSGYGRRLRYLVEDDHTRKIIGIIGLGDPVYALKDRDNFIGWTHEVKSRKLKHVMDAFVLGSIPPYNMIMGGKLVASLISSREVYRDFKKKYGGKKSLIREELFDGKLAGITTTSALGKSSVYDRIKIPDGSQFYHVGWTSGSGDFQFLNGHYDDLTKLIRQQSYTGKNVKWGTGIRSRRVVVRKSLSLLGLSSRFLYHGVRREVFFVPHGKNWKGFLCGETTRLNPYNLPVLEISEYVKGRWMFPRAERDKTYSKFKAESYSLLHPHVC